MCNGSIMDKLISFSLPLMLSGILQLMFNAVDIIVVGQFTGSQALAAVGSTTALIAVFTNLFIGISLGANVLAARFYASGKHKEMSETVHTSITLALISGIIMAFVGLLFSRTALEIMSTPDNVIDQSTLYMRIYFLGMPFFMLYNYGAAILRAVGDSKRPLYLLIICCIINIIFDFVLVLGFQGGVVGVGIATLLSQAVSAILVTLLIMYRTKELKLEPGKLCLKPLFLKKLLWIGLPTGIESAMYSISNVIIQAVLNDFGVDTVAAWAAFGKIDSFFWMINNAFGTSIVTFVGQNFGAGKMDRIKKAVRIWLVIAIATAWGVSGLILWNDRLLLGIFTSDTSVIDIGVRMVWSIAPFFFLFEFIEILSGALRAEGYVMVSTIMVLCGTCLFRIAWVTVITAGKSLEMILYCYPITWSICAVMFIMYYLWKQRKVYDRRL